VRKVVVVYRVCISDDVSAVEYNLISSIYPVIPDIPVYAPKYIVLLSPAQDTTAVFARAPSTYIDVAVAVVVIA
jgi:hypothetical protein